MGTTQVCLTPPRVCCTLLYWQALGVLTGFPSSPGGPLSPKSPGKPCGREREETWRLALRVAVWLWAMLSRDAKAMSVLAHSSELGF